MISFRTNNIQSLFRGEKEIILVYLGDKLVYKKKQKKKTKFNYFVKYNSKKMFNSKSNN